MRRSARRAKKIRIVIAVKESIKMVRAKNIITTVISLVMVITFGATASFGTPTVYKGYANPHSVISVEKLQGNFDEFVVVDFSKKESTLIKGALYIDRNKLFSKINGVKMMRASRETFERVLGEHGLTIDTPVVIYSDNDNKFAARFYWDLKALGQKDVRILDGGIEAWKAAGFDTVGKSVKLPTATYVARGQDYGTYADFDLIRDSTGEDGCVIVDTRTVKEYKKGRIPGAININFITALNKDMTFKTADELRAIYKDIPEDQMIVTYCLGGIRAAESWFVLSELLGFKNVKMYDGSWWEYEKMDGPIEK